MRYTLTVRGTPAPQGSKRHIGHGRMVEMSKAVGPWREAVRGEAQRIIPAGGALTGPVHVVIQFFLPRPVSLPRRVLWPAKRPDLDKLIRAVLDGLTEGGAWKDDGQVVKLGSEKLYAAGDTPPGAWISIAELEGTE